jgi:hypothetical protein
MNWTGQTGYVYLIGSSESVKKRGFWKSISVTDGELIRLAER